MCKIDHGIIISELMKNCMAGEKIATYCQLIARLKATGHKTKKHILDNRVFDEYKTEITEEVGNYELVPKGQHRRNIAEKAIQTWKAQINMQLNLLRFSHVTPNISAWTILNCQSRL